MLLPLTATAQKPLKRTPELCEYLHILKSLPRSFSGCVFTSYQLPEVSRISIIVLTVQVNVSSAAIAEAFIFSSAASRTSEHFVKTDNG